MSNYSRPSKKFGGPNKHHNGFGQSGQYRKPTFNPSSRPKPTFNRPKQSRGIIDEIFFPKSGGKKKRR